MKTNRGLELWGTAPGPLAPSSSPLDFRAFLVASLSSSLTRIKCQCSHSCSHLGPGLKPFQAQVLLLWQKQQAESHPIMGMSLADK